MHAGTPPDERPGVNREFFPPETPAAPLIAGCGPWLRTEGKGCSSRACAADRGPLPLGGAVAGCGRRQVRIMASVLTAGGEAGVNTAAQRGRGE